MFDSYFTNMQFLNGLKFNYFWDRSPGFGLSLVAESTKGVLLSAESSSRPADEGNVISPEDLGRQTAVSLLEEIYRVRLYITIDTLFCVSISIYKSLGILLDRLMKAERTREDKVPSI